jgi:uncharacterized SAM-binding protein YcdF (DUF218 family)
MIGEYQPLFIFLSKFLPLLVYPLGLVFLLVLLGIGLRKHPNWQKASLWIAVGLIWFGSNPWVAFGLTRSLEWRYLPLEEVPKAEAMVVLGGATESKIFPRPTVEVNAAGDRVLYAVRLYHQGKSPYLLLSGGSIDWLGANSSPAEDMAEILTQLGVPDTALWLETTSRNTYENAIYSKEILKREGVEQILLVTSAMHMPRAVALFEHQEVEVIPAPADYVVTEERWESLWDINLPTLLINLMPNVGYLDLTTTVLKEYIGIVVYRFRGWL